MLKLNKKDIKAIADYRSMIYNKGERWILIILIVCLVFSIIGIMLSVILQKANTLIASYILFLIDLCSFFVISYIRSKRIYKQMMNDKNSGVSINV